MERFRPVKLNVSVTCPLACQSAAKRIMAMRMAGKILVVMSFSWVH
jgi:hypothetical protein